MFEVNVKNVTKGEKGRSGGGGGGPARVWGSDCLTNDFKYELKVEFI